MLGEPDLDFTRLTRDAASGGQVEVHGTLSDYEHVTYPRHVGSFAEPLKERSAVLGLSGRQLQENGQAVGVGEGRDFRGRPMPRAPAWSRVAESSYRRGFIFAPLKELESRLAPRIVATLG
jgi:hypothetical protein